MTFAARIKTTDVGRNSFRLLWIIIEKAKHWFRLPVCREQSVWEMKIECCTENGFISELQREADSGSWGRLLCSTPPRGTPGRCQLSWACTERVQGDKNAPFPLEQEWLQKGESIAADFPGKRWISKEQSCSQVWVGVEASSLGCTTVPSWSRPQEWGDSDVPNRVNYRLHLKTVLVENLSSPSYGVFAFGKLAEENAVQSPVQEEESWL